MRSLQNLLEETLKEIDEINHTPEDIIFIGSRNGRSRCNWEEFKKLADVEYDSGYGGQRVTSDLIIVFKDGCELFRNEYDGSEWWEHHKPFNKGKIANKIIKTLFTNYGETIEEVNDEIN